MGVKFLSCNTRSISSIVTKKPYSIVIEYRISCFRANVNVKDKRGRTVLYIAAEAWRNNLAIIDILIQAGVDVNTRNNWSSSCRKLW